MSMSDAFRDEGHGGECKTCGGVGKQFAADTMGGWRWCPDCQPAQPQPAPASECKHEFLAVPLECKHCGYKPHQSVEVTVPPGWEFWMDTREDIYVQEDGKPPAQPPDECGTCKGERETNMGRPCPACQPAQPQPGQGGEARPDCEKCGDTGYVHDPVMQCDQECTECPDPKVDEWLERYKKSKDIADLLMSACHDLAGQRDRLRAECEALRGDKQFLIGQLTASRLMLAEAESALQAKGESDEE